MDLEGIADLVQGDDGRLADRIARRANKLRGTRLYWQQARRELEAFVYDLGCPHLFFTFSTADLQWWDLQMQMPDFETYMDAGEQEQAKLAWKNLQENPHIVAEYLDKRFKLFFRSVFQKVFAIEDWWYRYEWQARGNGHIHGFAWIKDCPSLEQSDVQSRERFLSFWKTRVTAINPGINLPPAARNPCNRRINIRSNTLQELAETLNRFQKHTKCSTSYCLR